MSRGLVVIEDDIPDQLISALLGAGYDVSPATPWALRSGDVMLLTGRGATVEDIREFSKDIPTILAGNTPPEELLSRLDVFMRSQASEDFIQ